MQRISRRLSARWRAFAPALDSQLPFLSRKRAALPWKAVRRRLLRLPVSLSTSLHDRSAQSIAVGPNTVLVPTPSATDIVITSPTGYPTGLPTETPEESCAVTTVTVTEIMTKPTAPGVSPPPYPTGSAKPSVPAPSGTGAYTTSPPLFTGAAAAVRVPAGIAGVLGLAAFVF